MSQWMGSRATVSPREVRLIRNLAIAALLAEVAMVAVVVGITRQLRVGIYVWLALVVFDFLILLPAGVFVGYRIDRRRCAEGWRPPSNAT
jgi:preprotein translocase subunit SecF